MATQRKHSDLHRPAPPANERIAILIAEDDSDTRDLYAHYFRSAGLRVETVADGVEACRRTVELMPDLVVMDLSLPDMDGWEATRRLKADQSTAHIPVIACTAHKFGPSVERALVAGCDAYVVKPCLPEDLLATIRRVLSRRTAPRRTA